MTSSKALSTKLKVFQELNYKIVLGTGPPISSSDVISLLKYFQSTLYGFLRDSPNFNRNTLNSVQFDDEFHLAILSKVAIEQLLIIVINLIENVGKLTSVSNVCEHILRTLHVIILFLDDEQLNGLPMIVASAVSFFPSSLHQNVIELLCSVVIPLVYAKYSQESFAIDSIPSVLTMVFQHVENPESHAWVFESLLSRKQELYKDLFTVIAYGPTEARLPAVCLLFHYWPELCPPAFQSCNALKPKHYGWEPWKPVICERTDCPNKAGKSFAMKMTTNAQISVKHGNKPPPFYVCLDCADALNRRDFDQLTDILLPSKQISSVCESKTCRSKNNTAIITCFSVECAFLNGNRPIRFCETCHVIRHDSQKASLNETIANTSKSTGSTDLANSEHIFQTQIPDVWISGLDLQPCMIESIITLIRETNPRWRQLLLGCPDDGRGLVGGVAGRGGSASTIPAAPAGPGGPQLPSDFLVTIPGGSVVQTGIGGSVLSAQNNQSPANQGNNLEGQITMARLESAVGTRGNYQRSDRFAVGPNGEPELTLEGRYDDEDHKVLAIYGAFLVGEKCRPTDKTHLDILTRITAGIFNLFLDTVYTNEDELGDFIERVKSEYMLKWIQEVQHAHLEVVLAVLLPHPVEVARIGSCWDALCGKTAVVKHGLSRIASLIPYDIMTFETWDYIIPYWLESIRTEVNPDDYRELENLLKKIFDATAGPFPFLPSKVYHFASERFIDASVSVQDQVLSWLEILTTVDVSIPMKELLTMFRSGTAAFFKRKMLYDCVCLVDRCSAADTFFLGDGLDLEGCTFSDADSMFSDSSWNGDEELMSDEHDFNLLDEMDEEDEEEYEEDYEEDISSYDDENCYKHQQEANDDEDKTAGTAGAEIDNFNESTSLLSAEGRNARKSSHDAIRFFLGEKKGPRKGANRGVAYEAEDKFAATSTEHHPNQLNNEKRQSCRFSMKGRRNYRSRSRFLLGNKIKVVYRATRCMGQMLDLIHKQLRLCDPFGHTGFTQETPQLILSLLSDMLQLTWIPTGIRYSDSKQDKNKPAKSASGNPGCMGYCTAPAPVPSTCSTTNVHVPPTPAGSSLAAFALHTMSSTSQLPLIPEDCAYCQNVCRWFELASRLCQHLAPVAPPSLPRLELSMEAIHTFLKRPDYPKWQSNLAVNDTNKLTTHAKTISDSQENISDTPTSLEPTEADLNSFPPTLRLIYQLLRCLIGAKGCAGVIYTLKDPSTRGKPNIGASSDSLSTDNSSVRPAPDGASSSPRASLCTPPELSETQVFNNFQVHPPRDPVVLRHILECLNFLIRVSNVLQSTLIVAARAAERAVTAIEQTKTLTVTTLQADLTTTAPLTPLRNSTRSQRGQANTGVAATATSLGVEASFVFYLVEHCLIPAMWNLLTAEHSHLASWVIPLLLQSLTIPDMSTVFWRCVETECTHADWKIRFHAMEKIFCLLRQLDGAVISGFFNGPASKELTMGRQPAASTVGNLAGGQRAGRRGVNAFRVGGHNAIAGGGSISPDQLLWGGGSHGAITPLHPFILNAIAHCFSRLIGSLDDKNSVVAQRTSFHLQSLDDNALNCCIQCLEYQFDTVSSDRTLLLQRMHQLSCALPSRQIFTWDFFIDRFGILSLEAQIIGKSKPDMDTVTDLNNMNKRSDKFQQQFNRAVFAVAQTQCLPSIMITKTSNQTPGYPEKLYSETSSFKHIDLKNSEEGSNLTSKDGESHVDQISDRRRFRPSVIKLSGFFPGGTSGDGDFTDSANKFLCSLQLKLDHEGADRSTLHQWVRLLLRFMATVDMDGSMQGGKGRRGAQNDELKDKKALSKVQRHLALLLGYADQAFNIPPYKQRNSTVFHAFISNVADVLDRNPSMGSCILHQTLMVLQVCASPQRYANDSQAPNFTLRLLEPHIRHHWLNTLIIILYKYEYNAPSDMLNTSSGSSIGHKNSIDLLSGSSDHANLSTSEPVGGLGLGRSSSHSPGHGIGGSIAFMNQGAGGGQWSSASSGGTRGIIEYLIRIVLNTLDTQVHICRKKTEDELLDSPSIFVPEMREASSVGVDSKVIRETETPIQEEVDAVVMPGITISQNTVTEVTCETSTEDGESTDDGRDNLDLSSGDHHLGHGIFGVSGERNISSSILTRKAKLTGIPHYTKKDQELDLTMGLRLTSPIIKKKASRTAKDSCQESREETNLSCQYTESTSNLNEKMLEKDIALATFKKHHTAPGAVSHTEKSITPPTVSEYDNRKGPLAARSPLASTAESQSSSELTSKTVVQSLKGKLSFSEASGGKVGELSGELTGRHGLPRLAIGARRSPISGVSGGKKERYHLSRSMEIDNENIAPVRQLDITGIDETQLSSQEGNDSGHPAPPCRKAPVRSSYRVSSTHSRPVKLQKPTPTGGSSSNSYDTSNSMASALVAATMNTERCPWCQNVLEQHDESTIGLGLICLATFVHREPSLAAPYLIDMLTVASRIATTTLYTWQKTLPHILVLGNSASIARQFIRCTLYNLAPNGLFVQLFQTPLKEDVALFRAIVSVLINFEEHMSMFFPIVSTLDNLNKRKTLPSDTLNVTLANLATYLESLLQLTEEPKWNHFISAGWSEIMPLFETFFRKLGQCSPLPSNLPITIRSMICILRAPTNFVVKQGVTDAYVSILRLIIEQCHVDLSLLIEICSLCNRTFKERAKSQLTKVVVDSLINALKFRVCLPDENLMKTLQLILMDAGGTLEPNQISEGITNIFNPQTFHLFSTGAAELMRPHITDCLNILSDVHMIHKVKQAQKMAVQPIFSSGCSLDNIMNKVSGGRHLNATNWGGGSGLGTSGGIGFSGGGGALSGPSAVPSLHEDTIGSHLKSGIAQFVALEVSRTSTVKDEDALGMLSPGLIVDESGIEDVPSARRTTSDKSIPSKLSGSLSGSGSFRSGGQSGSAGGGNYSAQRQLNRGSTSISFGNNQETDQSFRMDESSNSVQSEQVSGMPTGAPKTPVAPGHISLAVPSLLSRSPSIASVLANPGVGQQSIMSIGHFALVTTLSHTTRLDAPILQYLPWLKSIPSNVQQGPRDFLLCVERARTLTWLLLGATMHTALTRDATGLTCRPIPFTFVNSIADLVEFLIIGFQEQQKQQSVAVMSSLYHAFLLCQVWTVYCEASGSLHPVTSNACKAANATALEFWIKIMPTITHLLSISEDSVAINGHLLTVLEELKECRSIVVNKLITIWIPILNGKQKQLPGNMLKRLQKCIEWEPPTPEGRLHLLIASSPSCQPTNNCGKPLATANYSTKTTTSTSFASSGNVDVNLCTGNSLNGCNQSDGICAGHSLAPSVNSSMSGSGVDGVTNATFSEGCGCNGVGNGGFLLTRLVRWLRKQMFVLGRNEDQHSTATHIFIH